MRDRDIRKGAERRTESSLMRPDPTETRALIRQVWSQTHVCSRSQVSPSCTLLSAISHPPSLHLVLFLLLPPHLACPLCYPLPSFPVPISARAASFTEKRAPVAVIEAASEPRSAVGRGLRAAIAPQTVCDLPPRDLGVGAR